MKFQVLDGKHQVSLPLEGGITRLDIYIPGDIVETDENLVATWNRPASKKFARVADSIPVICSRPDARRLEAVVDTEPPPVEPVRDFSDHPDADPDAEQGTDDTFSNMTKAQLMAIAEENEIDLEGATRKEDIRARVLEHAGV